MKKVKTARNISVIIHFLYLGIGLWGYFSTPPYPFLLRWPFYASIIYGSFLIATTVNVTVLTSRYARQRKEKHQQDERQTSFAQDPSSKKLPELTYKMESLFWILNGTLTFLLSLFTIAKSFLRGVLGIFSQIIYNGGTPNPATLETLKSLMNAVNILCLIFFILLLVGLLAGLTVTIVLKIKGKQQKAKIEPGTPETLENEPIPVLAPEEPVIETETPKTEALPLPEPEAIPEVAPIPEPEAPKPVVVEAPAPEVAPEPETPKETIRPEKIKQPKYPAADQPSVDDEIRALTIKTLSKVMILGLPNPPIFQALKGTPNVAWVKDDALNIYFDYTSQDKAILEQCVKNNPKKFLLSSIDHIILEGPEGKQATAFYYTENHELKKLVFPKESFETFTALLPKKETKPVVEEEKKEATPSLTPKPTEPITHVVKEAPKPEQPKPQPAPSTHPNDPEARLARLQKLFDKKMISQEEYDKKRQEILDTF